MKPSSPALAFALLTIACSGGAPAGSVGQPCDAMHACTAPLTCVPDLPGGYCTADCSQLACGAEQTCGLLAGASLCLKPCAQMGDCRDGYQCFNSTCVPLCRDDADCGTGFQCAMGGVCVPFTGAPVGGACATDTDCSTRDCLLGACAIACSRDAACPSGQTCALNPVGDGAPAPTTHLQPACTARRNTAAPGAACNADGDCDRGTCQLGTCVELCANTPDCHAMNFECTKMSLQLDTGATANFQGCLPSTGTLSFDGASGVISAPDRTRSFEIFVRAPTFNFNDLVGVTSLVDPVCNMLYSTPADLTAFYALKVRYQPNTSCATMLVPNSPAVTIMPGPYGFTEGSSAGGTLDTRVYLKLAPAPIASGAVSLNFYITDLSQACANINAANAPTQLQAAIDGLRRIYQQVNVTIGNITYQDSPAPNVVKYQTSMTGMPLPDLDNTLEAATSNVSTTIGMDVVLVRTITDQNGGPSNILGIAGGIPASPVLGTPHSGAVVSIQSLCGGGGSSDLLAITMGHELGHTFGLFHSVEQDGHTDPLLDTQADGMTNLMYWLETSGQHLTVQQGNVIRSDVKVQ